MSDAADGDLRFDWQDSQDVLSALIGLVGLRGVVLATMDLGAPWRVSNAEARHPVFHTVASGTAVLCCPAASKPVILQAGDAVLLPRGGTYVLTDHGRNKGAPRILVPEPRAGEPRCSIRAGGRGRRTQVTCCAFRFQDVSAAPLLNLLPELVVVREQDAAVGVRGLVAELVREAGTEAIGTEAMVSRLAELCFLAMLRIHFAAEGAADSGLLTAIADPHVGRALGLMHASLDAPWTVATLASKVGMSRAAFAQRFAETTGESPIRYIQLCRIAEAKRMLAQTGLNTSEIGQHVGYTDPAGFSRAFRREVGLSPREYRRAANG